MNRVYEFLKAAETYDLATVEGDQPRVRPFGTVHLFEGKLYIQAGKSVAKQIESNPKVELCAMKGDEWIRVAGTLVLDDRLEAQESMLNDYPSLRAMYTTGTERQHRRLLLPRHHGNHFFLLPRTCGHQFLRTHR